MAHFFPSTGRALFFNFLAMSLGFGTHDQCGPATGPFRGFGGCGHGREFSRQYHVAGIGDGSFPLLGFETPDQEAAQAVQSNPVLSVSTMKEGNSYAIAHAEPVYCALLLIPSVRIRCCSGIPTCRRRNCSTHQCS